MPNPSPASLPQKIWDIAVVGGGPAGCTAAIHGAREGFSVILIEKTAFGGQMLLADAIDSWPGLDRPADGFALAACMKEHAVRAGAVLRIGTVTGYTLDGAYKRLFLDGYTPAAPPPAYTGISPKEILSRFVILATGARPKMLGLPGEEALIGHGVSFCGAWDGRLYRGKTAAVIGGGYMAAHHVLFLSRLCRRVFWIRCRQPSLSPAVQKDLADRDSVILLTPYRVTGFRTGGAPIPHVTGLELLHCETGNTSAIDCGGVFPAIGTIPQTEPVREVLACTETGAVITGKYGRCSLPGVYAAGDCRDTPLPRILTACADGAAAVAGILDELKNPSPR